MRSAVLPCVFLLAISGCSNDKRDKKSEPDPDSGVEPDSGVDADSGVEDDASVPPDERDDAVVVEWFNRYGFNSGEFSDEPTHLKDSVKSVNALVTRDGKTQVFPGEWDGTDRLKITGVPAHTPYVLEVQRLESSDRAGDPPSITHYPIDGARHVRIGSDYWGRATAQLEDNEKTRLALSVSTPATFAFEDTFSWIGLRSYFYRTATYLPPDYAEELVLNAPEEDSSESSNWTHPATLLSAPYGAGTSGLPSAKAGDDLLLLQTRMSSEEAPYLPSPSDPGYDLSRDLEPWSRFTLEEAVGVLAVDGANFANDTTNLISGDLELPKRKTTTLSVLGQTFAEVRRAAEYPKDVRATARVTLSQEAGAGPEVFVSVAPTPWTIYTRSRQRPVQPDCYPVRGVCPDLCCNPATDGYIDPGELRQEFEIPRAYASGMRDLFVMSYTYRKDWTHPDTGIPNSLSASVQEVREAAGSEEAFELELGPIRNLELNGAPLSWEGENTITESTLRVSFDAPSAGRPEYYEVYLIELQPDADLAGDDAVRRLTRTAVTLYTRETSFTLPGVLRPGRYYSLQVYATADGRDFTEPFVTQREASRATGIFSPVFHSTF